MATDSLPLIFSPIPADWLSMPASDFSFVLQEALSLVEHFPHLLQMIEEDLQKDALTKKEKRARDRQAHHQQQPFLPGTREVGARAVTEMTELATGCPRMTAQTCYLFLVIRGYLGGLKSQEAKDFLSESRTLHLYLAKMGIPMPSLSTIGENTNKVSQATRDAILDAQIEWIKAQEHDDFADIMIDSTAIEANSCWPTDSKLIWMLCTRLWRNFQKLDRFNLPNLQDEEIAGIIDDLHRFDFEIACAAGKKNAGEIREAKYREFYELAEAASRIYEEALPPLRLMADQVALVPSKQQRLETHLEALRTDIKLLDQVLETSIRRVVEKEKVPTSKKVASISDPDAAFIAKGQRETLLGYRPQVSKSAAGFVVAIGLPKGNASDSEQLRPICKATFQRTGVVPESLSVDDGYTSLENREWLKTEGVKVPSFSGSKGKKITAPAEWESEEFREARRMRSAVESVIFQLKRCFDFGRAVRRGIARVREELTAKVVAFNFYRLQYLIRH